MFLLDTNVVSELRRPQKADRNVVAWASTIPGALLIERKDATQGAVLRAWIEPAGFAWNLTRRRKKMGP
jgi:predicted nucleic acid-binding protein